LGSCTYSLKECLFQLINFVYRYLVVTAVFAEKIILSPVELSLHLKLN
jgi:hypothetical protein